MMKIHHQYTTLTKHQQGNDINSIFLVYFSSHKQAKGNHNKLNCPPPGSFAEGLTSLLHISMYLESRAFKIVKFYVVFRLDTT